jgi:hypothetical protein
MIMKRSEAVKELNELLGMVRYEDAINSAGGASVVSTEEYADIFLKKLEEKGLLPPNRENPFYCGDPSCCGPESYGKEWEPE